MTGQHSDQAELELGLDQLGLEVPGEAVRKLLQYAGLLREWSAAFNLVAPGERAALIPRHILDSLSIAPWLKDGALLDIGTGAGLPGLPLAIARPGMQAWLLDSAGKKIRFVRHVTRSLQLDNVHPLQARAGDAIGEEVFANITARAFASLAVFAEAARGYCDAQTRLLAMKGAHPARELEELPGWINVEAVAPIGVPHLRAQRHLVIMSLAAPTGQ